jgi:hypothetical protein
MSVGQTSEKNPLPNVQMKAAESMSRYSGSSEWISFMRDTYDTHRQTGAPFAAKRLILSYWHENERACIFLGQ